MDEKFVMLKRHGCCEGLTEEEIREIADDCELVQVETGRVLHRAGEHLKFLYPIVQGRLKQTIQDPGGNEVQRIISFEDRNSADWPRHKWIRSPLRSLPSNRPPC